MKNSGAKTVPVEATLSEKANPKSKFPASKSKSKSEKLAASKPRARVTNHKLPSQIPVVVPVASDQAPREKREEVCDLYSFVFSLIIHMVPLFLLWVFEKNKNIGTFCFRQYTDQHGTSSLKKGIVPIMLPRTTRVKNGALLAGK